jgi:hypothetical protein
MPAVKKKRTTLTLDPDVAARLEDEMHRQRKPFRQVVNEAIRRGLSSNGRTPKLPPFRVKVFKARLQPDVIGVSMNRLSDELETEELIAKLRRSQK